MAQTELQDRLAYLKSLRVKVRGVLDGSIDAAEIDSYSFGDSDGNQSAKRRDPKSLWELLEKIDSEIENLQQRIYGGGGIRTFGTNRYGIGL
jgi:hypothetical protein